MTIETELTTLLAERAASVPPQTAPELTPAPVWHQPAASPRPERRAFWLVAAGLLVALGAGAFAIQGSRSPGAASPASESGVAPVAPVVPATPAAGAQLADFDTLDVVEGQPTLVVFGASWCPHCAEQMPTYIDLLERLDSDGTLDGVRIIGVDVVGPEDGVTENLWNGWPYERASTDTLPAGVPGVPSLARWSSTGIVGEPLMAEDVDLKSVEALLLD